MHNLNYIYNSIKFIFTDTQIMDVDYPNNKQYQVNSWYNYYTCYDNLNKIDKINIEDFERSSERIINIIYNEAFILNKFKSIYLILSVILGLSFYLLVSFLIKAFQLKDIKLKY